MKITKVTIRGIKSHRETVFHPEDYTVIVGENNTGKSNIFFALRWFFKDVKKLSRNDVLMDYEGNPEIEIVFRIEGSEEIPDTIDKDYITGNEFTIKAYAELSEVKRKDVAPKYQLIHEDMKPKSLTKVSPFELIFIPSIRELSEEFKFTSSSSINKLVTRFLIQRIKAEDQKNRRFSNIKKSVEELSEYVREGDDSALASLRRLLKEHMLDYGNIEIDFKLEPPGVEAFIKSSFKPEIRIGKGSLDLDSQGMGFQRSLVFSLIAGVSEMEASQEDSVLYLIEEPELFLHPNHQISFRTHLRKLAGMENNQVMLTTHSPYFVNNLSNYSEIKRVGMKQLVSYLNEIKDEELKEICSENGRLMAKAKNDARNKKWNGKQLADEAEKIAKEDELRYLLWVNPERANAFLSRKVILVEGPTEKALMAYISDKEQFEEGKELSSKVSVIDTVGKFHMYKFAHLLNKLGIEVWIIFDNDDNGNRGGISHKTLNEIIKNLKTEGIIKDYLEIEKNLETAFGLQKNKHTPDTTLYHSLEQNEKHCRESETYKKIIEFINTIIREE